MHTSAGALRPVCSFINDLLFSQALAGSSTVQPRVEGHVGKGGERIKAEMCERGRGHSREGGKCQGDVCFPIAPGAGRVHSHAHPPVGTASQSMAEDHSSTILCGDP